MRLHRTAVAIAALTGFGLLAPVTPASAATTTPNLIRDAGAEGAKPVGTSGGLVPVPQWTPLPGTQFTAVKYGTPEFIDKSGPGPKAPGLNFFAGGLGRGASSTGNSAATQVDSLTQYLPLVRSGKTTFTLSGWFGGFSNQRDYAILTVVWRDAKGVPVGTPTTIGNVTPVERKNVTGLFARSKSGLVPKAATSALLKIRMVRLDGSYIDGYADNLSLVLSTP